MRVVFDILGSPERSGGMRLHATRIVSTWSEVFPSDKLVLIGPKWVTDEPFPSNVTGKRWPNESILTRAPGQIVLSAIVAKRSGAEVVISLSPVVTPFSRRPTIAYQHDWRHLKKPEEFAFHQKLYRNLWRWSARWASVNACISDKTLEETLTVAPGAAVARVSNGFDDARSWDVSAVERVPGRVVTFGHHNNKRPELVIHALADAETSPTVTATVLGATGRYRDELRTLADTLGVADRCEFPGFVDASTYRELIASADLVALVSSDEGFGLPVAEAMCLGTAALVTSDSGITSIFGDYPVVSEPTPADVARGMREAMNPSAAGGTAMAAPHTWTDTVTELRRLAAELIPAR